MKSWLEKVNLSLIDEQTEVVLIINRRNKNTVKVKFGGHMTMTEKLSFRGYLQ